MAVLYNSFATKDVDAADKVDYWSDTLSSAYEGKSLEVQQPSSFSARIEHFDIGDASISNVKQGPSVCRHGREHTGRDKPTISFYVQLFGSLKTVVDDEPVQLAIGDMFLTDSEEPYRNIIEQDLGMFIMQFDKNMFLSKIGEQNFQNGMAISGSAGSGKIASSFLQNYWKELSLGLPGEQAVDTTAVCLDLISIAAKHGGASAPESRTFNGNLFAIREFIEANLGETDLSPGQIADEFDMSVRNLHKMFSKTNFSVSNYVRHRRLETARNLLMSRDTQDMSITDIALQSGFSSTGRLSEAFRQEYGVTPRQYRQSL